MCLKRDIYDFEKNESAMNIAPENVRKELFIYRPNHEEIEAKQLFPLREFEKILASPTKWKMLLCVAVVLQHETLSVECHEKR